MFQSHQRPARGLDVPAIRMLAIAASLAPGIGRWSFIGLTHIAIGSIITSQFVSDHSDSVNF